MNKAKFNEEDYIDFIVAMQGNYSCLEVERIQPASSDAAHDAFTRLLQRMDGDANALWLASCHR